MIDGITVLNQTEIYIGIIPGWVYLALVIGCIICAIMALIFDSNHWTKCTISSGVLAVICILVFFVLIIWLPVKSSGRYKYECTIDKSVSMTEVYEKYKVVEQRGDIWVLEDKE